MNSLTSEVAFWITDYYLATALLLLLVWVAMRFVRQPAHRLTIVRMTMVGLIALAIICNLPTWPKAQVLSVMPSEAATHSPTPARESSYEETRPELRPEIGLAEVPVAQPDPLPRKPPFVEPVSADPDRVSRVEATPSSGSVTWSGTVVAVFSTGLTLMALWLVFGAVQTILLCRRASRAPASIEAELVRIVGKGRKVPRLLCSPAIGDAIVLGILRPTILLPEAMVKEGRKNGLRGTLAHEWAHITNGDLWLLAASRCLLLLLFAHPLFWFLRRRLTADQEIVADAMAAGEIGRGDYAKELVARARIGAVGAVQRIPTALAIRERASQLERRVTILLDESVRVETSSSRRWRFASLATAGLIVVSLSVLTLKPTSYAVADPAEAGQAAVCSASTEPGEGVAESKRQEADSSGESSEEKIVTALKQLGAIINDYPTDNGKRATFRNIPVTEEAFALLKQLRTLTRVSLYQSEAVAGDLLHLTELSTLDTLWLNDAQFTSVGVEHLKKLPNFRRLFLFGGEINDERMQLLEELPKLEFLGLFDTKVTERGLKILSKLPNFRSLTLASVRPKTRLGSLFATLSLKNAPRRWERLRAFFIKKAGVEVKHTPIFEEPESCEKPLTHRCGWIAKQFSMYG